MKTLKMDETTALRLYKTASTEFKEILEQSFGKKFFNQKITDRVKSYSDICNILNVSDDDDDIIIEAEGLEEAEIKVVKSLVKKIRIAKVLNEGHEFRMDGSENRYYPYFSLSWGSGLVFSNAGYDSSHAYTGSASRLCFKTRELTEFAGKLFCDIYNDFIAPR